MPETTRFRIGTEVTGTDGSCGELERVVIDPVAMAVTHLVVVPKHRGEIARACRHDDDRRNRPHLHGWGVRDD